ncbi:MAG: glycosyltransferase [Candidatus Paceibacterota bacterium]
MNFEVLISTMHKDKQEIYFMLIDMNISCDAIVIVQGDSRGYDEITLSRGKARIFYTKDRGLSKSRNMALKHSKADIVLLADDDLFYYDYFDQEVIKTFKENGWVDIIIFNIDSYKKTFPIKTKELSFWTVLGFSSCQIAFRRKSVLSKNICFNESFGSGSGVYYSGEDNIFLSECFKCFRVFYVPIKILKRIESSSSWFDGFNEKYLFDRGAIFYAISRKYFWVLMIQFAIRKKKFCQSFSFYKIFKLMFSGYLDYKKSGRDNS